MTTQEVISLLSKAVLAGNYLCPSGVIGQLILEVGWSLNTPKDYKTGKESYNLGNIKGEGPAGHVTIITTEYYDETQMNAAKNNGTLISETPYNGKFKCQVYDNFRAYHNYTEAIEDHFNFLKSDRYVQTGVLKATTPEAYAKALYDAGYATDPHYVDKIISIVNQYNLRQFDKKPALAYVTYKVVSGDTLSEIALHFGVTVDQIKTLNGLKSDLIQINQVLKIKAK